ncbi:MAG: energy-coupling factor transporter ATPase [Ruminococcaceae bacterium]|nr:energy-coupling factor transporter ATPase [Oscillospiraceae bacterium]
MNILEVKQVSYLYGEGTPFAQKALNDVSVGFEAGRITGLIGHTGCGKSTLVQLLNGLLKPTAGTVLLKGKDINEKGIDGRTIRAQVGLVFQYPEYQLFEETVYADIAYGPKNLGLEDSEIERRIHEVAEFVGIPEDCFSASPFDLSGGQKRRVAIAGIMAMDPEVLILDEPAAGLDPVGREEILGGIHSYQRRRNNTVIIVSHCMEDMARYADRLIVMDHGTIAMSGTCREIFGCADRLTEVGLDVPQITRFMLALKARGVDVRTDVFTVEEARAEILRVRGGDGRA